MISFKRFLAESSRNPAFVHHETGDYHEHIHDMGDHNLHVMFHRKTVLGRNDTRDLKGKNHWSVDFATQGHGDNHAFTYNRQMKGKSSKHRHKTIMKVKQSIDHFIGKHKPKSLEMQGNTEKKQESYARLATKLAKKHKGKRHLLGTHVERGEATKDDGSKISVVTNYHRGTDHTARIIFPHHKE